MADEISNSPLAVDDDSLAGLISNQAPPSSLDEISPDVKCDQQMEDLFNLNEPKDIINGNQIYPVSNQIYPVSDKV